MMRRFLLCAVAAPSLAAAQPVTVPVAAKGETQPVGTANADAADDPAIWRNAADPAKSLIVATDKKAGLHVYGLDGKSLHFVAAGRVNNVDLIDRGTDGVLVVASDRNDVENALLQFYRLDTAAARLVPLGSTGGGAGEAYGVCLYDSGRAVYAFSVIKQGAIHQVKLAFSATGVSGTIVRSMVRPSQTEGCVADPRTRSLYVGEEDVGIWRFSASEGAPLEGKLVAPVDGKQLVADVEGLAVAEGRRRYLVASSQGDNSYALYSLPSMKPAGRFRIAAGAIGATEETDGIALATGDFGPDYRGGLFVAQDGDNAPNPQNFKFVDWRDVLDALSK
jgi:3-phytase